MNWFVILWSMVQLWSTYAFTAEKQLLLDRFGHKQNAVIEHNPWRNKLYQGYYMNKTLAQGQLTDYNKAVAHFALKDDLDIRKAELSLLEQGVQLAQASTRPLAANISQLFRELIANKQDLSLNYIEKYAVPLIGPIPDHIKQLPIRPDTQDYISRLNSISQWKSVVPILGAQMASISVYSIIPEILRESRDYTPNPLLPLLTYTADNKPSIGIYFDKIIEIMANLSVLDMTGDEEKQYLDALDSILTAECRSQYGRAFVEEMGAYSRQPADSQPLMKQYLH